jgi:hypothetical protein
MTAGTGAALMQHTVLAVVRQAWRMAICPYVLTGTGGQVNGWLLAKYALALAGIALVLLADYVGRRWLGYVGLGLVVSAFLLRFVQRRRTSGS